jgi:hypothetical protein
MPSEIQSLKTLIKAYKALLKREWESSRQDKLKSMIKTIEGKIRQHEFAKKRP